MIGESPPQVDRRDFLRAFFATATIRPSSVGSPPPPPAPRPAVSPPHGSKTQNQALARPGKIIFQDCDGAEVGRLEWDRRKILTEGDQIIRTGCEDTSYAPE